MAPRTQPVTIPPGLRVMRDLNVALNTWSTSQRAVIGLAADFAESGEWAVSNAASAAHWIASVADIEVCTAREWIRVGKRLRFLPLIAALFDADELSYSKVRTLSRLATPENEGQLAAIAKDVPAGHLPRARAAWLHRNSDDHELERHQHQQRSATWRNEPDGMVTFSAHLPPLVAGVLISHLTSRDENPPDRNRHPAVANLVPTTRRCARAPTQRGSWRRTNRSGCARACRRRHARRRKSAAHVDG